MRSTHGALDAVLAAAVLGGAGVGAQESAPQPETVRIVHIYPPVTVERAPSMATFSDAFVHDLPIPGRFYQNVLTLAPGVRDLDGDGNPTVHGASSKDFRAEIGGVANVDPLTGRFAALINSDAIEELTVVTSGARVEFGRAQGGFAVVGPRSSVHDFAGSVGFLFRSSKLDGTGAHDSGALPEPEFHESHPSAQVSGPIVTDRLWYRLAYEHLQREEPLDVVTGLVVQTQERGIHADQLSWQVSPRHRLAFRFQSDALTADSLGVSSTTPAESTQTLETGTATYALQWTVPASPRLFVESTVAWQDIRQEIYPTREGQRNDCVFGSLETVRCTDLATSRTSGSHPLTVAARSERLTLRSQGTWYTGKLRGATHQFRFGFDVEDESFGRSVERLPRATRSFYREIADPEGIPELRDIAILASGLAAPAGSDLAAKSTSWAAWVEDQIRPAPSVAVTAGLRLDRQEVAAPGRSAFDPAAESAEFLRRLEEQEGSPSEVLRASFTAYEDLERFARTLAPLFGPPVPTLILPFPFDSLYWPKRQLEDVTLANTDVSPFLSVAWDPRGQGRDKLAASYRRYHGRIDPALVLVESDPATTVLAYEAVLYGIPEDPFVRYASRRVPPAVNAEVVDHDLRTPYQDELRVLYERELVPETLLHVEYLHRDFERQIGTRDLNHATGDYGQCQIANTLGERPVAASPGTPSITDPYTGEVYQDTDPGNGDGRTDDCAGRIVFLQGVSQPVERPDGVADPYTLNPGWNAVRQVGNFNHSEYEAVVVELVRRRLRNLEGHVSYTWSVHEGNAEDYRPFLGTEIGSLDPQDGPMADDVRHVLEIAAAAVLPAGFRLGGVVHWQSGLPYSVLARYLALDDAPPAYPRFSYPGPWQPGQRPARVHVSYPTGERNGERNDASWLVDAKLTKELQLGRGMNVQLSAEVFNLLDDTTYAVYDPDFEQGERINGVNAARRTFGRRWQLGVRLAF